MKQIIAMGGGGFSMGEWRDVEIINRNASRLNREALDVLAYQQKTSTIESMKRILIVECKQEVSTFNPAPSHYEDFLITHGPAVEAMHRAAHNEVGGALNIFDNLEDIEVVTVFSARAITSGGTLVAADFQRLAAELLQALREAPKVDGAYFALHGAMSAENEDDPEGYILQEARKILGEALPLVASFDLHGILTERMVQHVTAFNCYRTYPHVDLYETGQRAAKLLHRVMDSNVKPVIAKIFIPALVRGNELITEIGLIRHAENAAIQLEESGRVLAAGLFWGNPFTDVSQLGSNSFVITDGDAELAKAEALRIANLFWEHHEMMRVPLTRLDDAAQQAHDTIGKGTTILVDAADATSSGASGDSNAILRKLIEIGYTGSALMPIVDVSAVQAAFAAGVGSTVKVTVGGELDPQRFPPLEVEAYVHLLSDGRFRSESFAEPWFGGNTAVLQIGSITLVTTSRPVSLYDRSLFLAHGQDPQKFDCVVVKSPHCEPQMFHDWAARYIDVDAPGATSANLKSLGHTLCPRPMWPLDDEVKFEPVVKVFSR